MTLNDFFKLTTNMIVIWDNYNIPIQLDIKKYVAINIWIFSPHSGCTLDIFCHILNNIT